ncbi:lycopene cyclase family protein [Deinococcus metallilatus]|uniref:Lycopene beta-cyclase n=1 Tax=Deinococcus metallilatus TaxID=1211322 RepID=A0AAJ5F5B2_9DEIO|nr:lycopene cyclase family protein [Deinococcus metallilatus]MBB5296603.1 lycopene beta-cyclase [Deinococcus metallilatus]QBY08376.1 lycopene cyclase family protein [Deinococcus metallilatus]RXJ11175.1 lycopene cyclase family protein [Deinococcus metallilatus]TLK24666.1 lycopene cyclase family protein [Deinococcus metallilatus]GMA17520.1 putative carotenoid cyclase [Deinococcus metallilatus]
MPAASPATDALVVGGGPAGLGLAAELAACGLRVWLVAPHPPRPFPATYGAWLDELPAWTRTCLADVWTDVRAYTGERPTPLLRPYALLDNARLLETLLARAGSGLTWTVGTVRGATRLEEGWEVHGAGGETWYAPVVVDAGGHVGSLSRPRYTGGAALQTAFGIVAHFDRPPAPPGAMVWMDHRASHLAPAGVSAAPTFLYAMHLGGSRYLVEETSLIARPGLPRALLERRLHARLAAQGTPPREVEREEWVAFPMNAAAPCPGPILAFGSAAGLVHPVSGFQVAGALQDAPEVAEAVAGALAGHDPWAAVQAGWTALWPPERRAAREVALLGVDALLALPGDQLPAFFEAFFRLPAREWRAFLAPHTDAGTLARTMLRVFAHAPNAVRAPLARAALGQTGVSGRALRAAVRGF